MPLRLGPLIPSKNIRILPVLNRNQIHQKAHKTLSLVLLYPGNASQENPNSFLLKSRSCPMSNAFYFCPHNLFYYRRVCSRKFHFPVPPSKASFPLLAFLGAFSSLHVSQHVRLLFGVIYTWKHCPM